MSKVEWNPSLHRRLQHNRPRLLSDLVVSSSSGRSHSIFGSPSEEGILSLSIDRLITMNGNGHLKFELTFLEIYNEKVTDLLATPVTPTEQSTSKSSSFSKNARAHILNKFVSTSIRTSKIREHPLLGPYLSDLKYISVTTKEDFQSVLNLGNQQRSVASPNANQRSSRSHAIFTIKISRVDVPQSIAKRLLFESSATTSSTHKKNGKQHALDELEEQALRLNFVDLAGSEKSQQFHGSKGKNDRFAVSVMQTSTSLYNPSYRKVFTSINRCLRFEM